MEGAAPNPISSWGNQQLNYSTQRVWQGLVAPQNNAVKIIAGAVGGTAAISVLAGMGAPEGLMAGAVQAFRQQIFAIGGPLALGIVAAQYLGGSSEIQAAYASALAFGGMMATGVLPMQIDVQLLTTVAAGAVGVYAGQLVA